tara:strand:- start:1353 stop:2402 length:1050 start_codon:yes stop_codon:yes gene_type:complete
MKKFTYLLLFLLLITSVSAFTLVKGEELIVMEPSNEDLYVVAGQAQVNAPIEGDLFVFGGDVTVNSLVTGDILIGAGNIVVNNKVVGNIIANGGNIEILGDVTGDITANGGNIEIKSEKVVGNIHVNGGAFSVSSEITGDIKYKGGDFILDSIVEGNVKAYAQDIKLTENAQISGNLEYSTKSIPTLERNQIKGELTKKDKYKSGKKHKIFYKKILFLIFALIVAFAMPKFSDNAASKIKSDFWKVFLIGLITLIAFPFIMLFLIITIIGIPFAILFALLFALAVCFGIIFSALFLGRLILKKQHIVWAMLLGIILFLVLLHVPVIWWIVKCLAIVLGIGSIIMVFFKK